MTDVDDGDRPGAAPPAHVVEPIDRDASLAARRVRPFVAPDRRIRTVAAVGRCCGTTTDEVTMSNPAKGQSGDGQQHSTRSAQEQKAAEVQAAGSAKADAGHPAVTEGGKAEAPTSSPLLAATSVVEPARPAAASAASRGAARM